MNRIYIFTGKGGVGKSSVATAHAYKSAKSGKKTLLVSTDMAHNLGDIFERKLSHDIETVFDNLDVYEIDPNYVCENDFADIIKYAKNLLADSGEISIQDISIFPGAEELFSLLKISEIYKSGVYERIIVDCAPTGETLSLLKFPELLSWYMEKLFPIGKVGVRILAPVSKSMFKIEMPNKQAMNDIDKIYVKLMELEELLKNRDITSVRIVSVPEKMVVEETKRNYMYMNLYNFNVDGLYINRILPKDIGNDFFDKWIKLQGEYIACLKETFADLPIYEIPWYDEELKGVANIERLVGDVLKDESVFDVKVLSPRESFEKTEEGYVLKVHMPCADKGDIDLYQALTDIVIKAGNFKRNIPLPNTLVNLSVAKAEYRDGALSILFTKE
ncbi:MAG: ArsA family ATPase [Lachnospiraceae bacterium]|nr:ArsA family ATPase [Lachnospiraceae bacterium]